jgi:hypothetical protein
MATPASARGRAPCHACRSCRMPAPGSSRKGNIDHTDRTHENTPLAAEVLSVPHQARGGRGPRHRPIAAYAAGAKTRRKREGGLCPVYADAESDGAGAAPSTERFRRAAAPSDGWILCATPTPSGRRSSGVLSAAGLLPQSKPRCKLPGGPPPPRRRRSHRPKSQ